MRGVLFEALFAGYMWCMIKVFVRIVFIIFKAWTWWQRASACCQGRIWQPGPWLGSQEHATRYQSLLEVRQTFEAISDVSADLR